MRILIDTCYPDILRRKSTDAKQILAAWRGWLLLPLAPIPVHNQASVLFPAHAATHANGPDIVGRNRCHAGQRYAAGTSIRRHLLPAKLLPICAIPMFEESMPGLPHSKRT